MTWRTACQTAGSRPKQVVQHRWPRRQPPGQSTAIPKTADGAVEMMRQLTITRDTAVKARTTAMHTLKQIVVHASPVLREAVGGEFVGIRHRSIFGSREPGVPREVVAMA